MFYLRAGGKPEALWEEGGHLVDWNYGSRDERWRATILAGKTPNQITPILRRIILGEANARSVVDRPGGQTED